MVLTVLFPFFRIHVFIQVVYMIYGRNVLLTFYAENPVWIVRLQRFPQLRVFPLRVSPAPRHLQIPSALFFQCVVYLISVGYQYPTVAFQEVPGFSVFLVGLYW